MYRTKVTPPISTDEQNVPYKKSGTFSPRQYKKSSSPDLKMERNLSMQPLEIIPAPFFIEKSKESHLKITLTAPDAANSDDVPALIAYSSQETDETRSSWGTTQISCANGKKVLLDNVATARLQVQKDDENTSSCENMSLLAESPQSRPILNRSISELSRIPVVGGDTMYETESDFEPYESGISRFQIPVDHRTRPEMIDCDRRVSDARSEALEKYRGELNSRLKEIMLDFDSKIDSLIVAAKHDFASLRRDYTRKTSFRSYSRRA